MVGVVKGLGYCFGVGYPIVSNHLPWKVDVGVKYNSKSKTRQGQVPPGTGTTSGPTKLDMSRVIPFSLA